MASVRAFQKAIRAAGSAKKARASMRFFKTGKGEYGEGDLFFGLTVPEQRAIAKQFNDLTIDQAFSLLQSKYHEERMTALFVLVDLYENGTAKDKHEIYTRYISAVPTQVNNWDLVDSSAHKIVGEHLLERNRAILTRLVKSSNLWERRVAMIATLRFIQEEQYEDVVELAKLLLNDKEDLMHKASGWMLREAGNRDQKVLINFLEQHAHEMPRTMLRYSIEKLPKSTRQKYMNR